MNTPPDSGCMRGVGKKVWSGMGILLLVGTLTACTPTRAVPTPRPTVATAQPSTGVPAPTPTSIPATALPSNMLYPFSSGAAIGTAPLSVNIRLGRKTVTYLSSPNVQKVGSCKVVYYSATFGQAKTEVTQTNQQQLSEAAIQSALRAAGVTAVVRTGQVATTGTLAGKPALIQTATSSYREGQHTATLHARAFTNQEIMFYTQECPNGAILDIAHDIRFVTD